MDKQKQKKIDFTDKRERKIGRKRNMEKRTRNKQKDLGFFQLIHPFCFIYRLLLINTATFCIRIAGK